MQTDIQVVKAIVMTMIQSWDLGMSMATIIRPVPEIVEMMMYLSHREQTVMEMDLSIVMIVMTDDAFDYVGNAYMDSTTECMIDADEDGYGADLTLTCCLEIEMFDNTNGDWEGAQVELELGENVQYFSLEKEEKQYHPFCLTEEERLNVNLLWRVGFRSSICHSRPRWNRNV